MLKSTASKTWVNQHVPASTEPGPGRIPELDGLRGLAILLVLLYHGLSFEAINRGEAILKLLFGTYGWCGVDLFFVLSGFLITGILLDTKNGHSYFRNFYLRRILRIFPLYYGTLGVAFFILPAFSTWAATIFHSSRQDRLWYWTYLMNYRNPLPAAPLGHFWSLCIEEQFYLFWPLIVWLCNRRVFVSVCIGLTLVPLILRLVLLRHGFTYDDIHTYTITRLDSLVFGALVASFAHRKGLPLQMRNNKVLARVFWSVFMFVLALGMITKGLPRNNFWTETFGLWLLDCFFAIGLLALLAASPGSLFRRFFETGILRSFGKYSYAMYVLNWPIVVFLFHEATAGSRKFSMIWQSQVPSACAFAVGSIALTYCGAVASYHLYEKHFLKLKRWFRYDRA